MITAFLLSQYVQNDIKANTQRLEKKYAAASEKQRQQMAYELGQMQKAFNEKLVQLKKEQDVQHKQFVKAQAEAQARAQKEAKSKKTPEQQPITQVFSVMTPPGKRAITIKMPSLSAVGGLIKSGDRVDIIAKLRVPDQGDDPKAEAKEITTVLFQDIQVLAVGTQFVSPATALMYATQQKSKMLNITLAMDPQEAALLSFVQESGDLKLSLRSPAEQGTNIIDVATWDGLADFLLERQGTKLVIPVTKKEEAKEKETGKKDEKIDVTPKIQIFKSGQETSF